MEWNPWVPEEDMVELLQNVARGGDPESKHLYYNMVKLSAVLLYAMTN